MRTLIKHINNLKNIIEVEDFLVSLFTSEEIREFETRIKIIKLLIAGKSQRKISKELNVGIATVSRGASELKQNHFKFLKK